MGRTISLKERQRDSKGILRFAQDDKKGKVCSREPHPLFVILRAQQGPKDPF
jgi:hypothetical protein